MTPQTFPDPHYLGSLAHERPGYEDFPQFTLDVVSAELPCGASWLASMLLECDCAVWNLWNVDMREAWHRAGPRRYEYRYPGNPWSRTIPALTTGRVFAFNETPVARFSHALPGSWEPSSRAILFVRDPRDALFSAWRRGSRAGAIGESFVDWVRRDDPQWGVPRPLAYLLYLATWKHFLRRLQRPLIVVRFEDTKMNAMQTFNAIRTFVGGALAGVSNEQTEQALRISSFEHVHAIEQEMLDEKLFSFRVNISGQAYEHKAHFDLEMHRAVSCAAAHGNEHAYGEAIYDFFGYDRPKIAERTATNLFAETLPWFANCKAALRGDVEHAYRDALNEFFAITRS